MHKPFEINFKFESDDKDPFAIIRINRKTGELYFFPIIESIPVDHKLKLEDCDTNGCNIIDNIPDHFSWHKGERSGRKPNVHIKFKNGLQKQIIAEAEKNFVEFDKRSVFPILSFSVRTKDEEKSVICLIAGRDLMKNLSLLPDPYSKFVVKGQKNNHITSFYDSRSELSFAHMFIQIPIFLPINDRKSLFSATCPLHEDFLLDLPQI